MKEFCWIKKGLVFKPNIKGFSHASHPCIIQINKDEYLLAFTCRDKNQRSHIFLTKAIFVDSQIKFLTAPKLSLSPGPIGHFDCDGTISVCFIQHKGHLYLYYVGWQNLPDKMWQCDTGRLRVDPLKLKLEREFTGPVLGRDKNNPLFAAGTAFLIINDLWHVWYNSGIKWEQTPMGLKHYYGIHHATSRDGINWDCEKEICIPFQNKYEYAFGRPHVIFYNHVYYMFFAHRATKNIANYRMGFAYSTNGKTWRRNDALAGIDVSDKGWDSQMICYPYLFEHRGRLFMLYNGNGYGKTGFGLAVLEKD